MKTKAKRSAGLLGELRDTIASVRRRRGPCSKPDADGLQQVLDALESHRYADAYRAYRWQETGCREYVSDRLVLVLTAAQERDYHAWDADAVWRNIRTTEIAERIEAIDRERSGLAAELQEIIDVVDAEAESVGIAPPRGTAVIVTHRDHGGHYPGTVIAKGDRRFVVDINCGKKETAFPISFDAATGVGGSREEWFIEP